MRKRSEITVFLSMIIVCVLSLILGLLESARTAGARLYLEMSANSAISSVMSQYNRNLWDMYHLLFLEYESEAAVEQSFTSYLEFYTKQNNLYPMQILETAVTKSKAMTDDSGNTLEEEILSYMNYRLPDIAADFAGVAKIAAETVKTGDFRHVFEVCHQAGQKTQRLEKCRLQAEKTLLEMKSLLNQMKKTAKENQENSFRKCAKKLEKEMDHFFDQVERYEKEVKKASDYLEEIRSKEIEISDYDATQTLSQEILAYEQIEADSKRRLEMYREKEKVLYESKTMIEEAVEETEELKRMEWLNLIQIPDSDNEENINQDINREKMSMLDRLEEVFQMDALKLVLPEDFAISSKRVSLYHIPSKLCIEEGNQSLLFNRDGSVKDGIEDFLIQEYCFLKFDSCMNRQKRKIELTEQPLLYEQEYLLFGKSTDYQNLKETAERLLTIRSAMNLLYLLGNSEKRAEADRFAAAISGGNAAIQVLFSFLLIALWAFGEAVCDVRLLFDGGKVPFWKSDSDWKLEMESLLSFPFQKEGLENSAYFGKDKDEMQGNDYKDYLRILYFLMNRQVRNYRMMDVIQWNIQTIQKDFSVFDCISELEIKTTVKERHLFLIKDEYTRTITSEGSY